MRLRKMMLMIGVISVFAGLVVFFFLSGRAGGQELANMVSLTYSLQPAPHVTVTNNYSSRLTGMVITVSSTAAPNRTTEIIWADSGVNFRQYPPLDSGQSRSFPVGPIRLAPEVQPHLMAIAFEDGTSAGDPQWLSKLHGRRQAAYDEIGAVTAVLNRALAEHQSNDQIISTLVGMRDSLKTSNTEREARFAARLVIETTIRNLEQGGVRDTVGDPQKTIPATVFPLFAEWRGAIKRH